MVYIRGMDLDTDDMSAAQAGSAPAFKGDFPSVFVTAQDGLRLHVRDYRAHGASALSVVCLPGLARTAEDFDELATALATSRSRPRRVLALDYRGRGLSHYDRNPANYSLPVELSDLTAVLTALEVGPAVFIGSSRGGILTMLLAATRPAAIAGAVLNDIGPVIESKGLMRIKSYVGKLPQPRSFEEGAEVLRRLFDVQFPKLSPVEWQAAAKRMWREQDGQMQLTYDVNLAKTLASIDPEGTPPSLWNQFDALARVPVMVIRGANSDLLAPATVVAMRARHPAFDAIEVPDQGHTPLLSEPGLIAKISLFLLSCDQRVH